MMVKTAAAVAFVVHTLLLAFHLWTHDWRLAIYNITIISLSYLLFQEPK